MFRTIIGGFLAIIGLVAAVSVVDGSAYEMAVRLIGTVVFIVGCLVAKVFDFQTKRR